MIVDLINEFPTMEILKNELLNKYTHTAIGGPADWLVFPHSIEEVHKIVDFAHENELLLTVLGNSSNLLIKDGGIRGIVLMMTKLVGIRHDADSLTVLAGTLTIDTSEYAYQQGLTGFEWAAGIPGSIGGAVYMNAGAYNGETNDILASVDVITRNGKYKTYTKEEAKLNYRDSVMQHTHDVIIAASFQLQKGDKTIIRATMDDFNQRRRDKQPLELPSAGSTFKRPTGYYAGKLIMDAGLQGYRVGGAEVSKKHAGFVVNIDHATASDFLQVIKHVQAVVYEKDKVKLEPEVRIMGSD
ncbi:UDP-N-acetylmuramate dehydrogenase [Periweissella beninensis]|uniref:UDP-N-acetylenolpyruvoylglucosamine reductase n=1 Tax=Periweissella beninensis TaxID=504936 RepID=A0ABT0VJM9_9LACO|nr:UDP-N-acetylmuramate dehydrogenase [Periweissella beninensis]MBM7544542.1 UDP-N-acetylmuramate dehydrogenase [Periweissella beninensis]MCM2438041.1 UDP-N-acetylmuramate dehydrogenase [Periweissella beninensis]MCT4395820.1 UDP-N-acetylmuramate dehydrogenase [Periweissella beninensis]